MIHLLFKRGGGSIRGTQEYHIGKATGERWHETVQGPGTPVARVVVLQVLSCLEDHMLSAGTVHVVEERSRDAECLC